MASIDNEKLVLHARECLVVHDLLEEALLRLRGQSLDCICPCFERRGIEGIREEVVFFSLHQLWRKGANGLWTECRDCGSSVTVWDGKENRRKIPGHGGVIRYFTASHIIAPVMHYLGCSLQSLHWAQSRARPTLTITLYALGASDSDVNHVIPSLTGEHHDSRT
jgi:hypothetical protein